MYIDNLHVLASEATVKHIYHYLKGGLYVLLIGSIIQKIIPLGVFSSSRWSTFTGDLWRFNCIKSCTVVSHITHARHTRFLEKMFNLGRHLVSVYA